MTEKFGGWVRSSGVRRRKPCTYMITGDENAKPDLHPKKRFLVFGSFFSKYPANFNRKVVILQHDNARPHKFVNFNDVQNDISRYLFLSVWH